MNIIVFTNLFPVAKSPSNGIFILNRIKELAALHHDLTVVVPLPYFPLVNFFHKRVSLSIKKEEIQVDGIRTIYFKYFHIPLLGMRLQPFSIAHAGKHIIRLLDKDKRVDLIDAHYLYPDGVAAGLISKATGIPFIVSARGSDVNILLDYSFPRRMITKTLQLSSHIICVSRALKNKLVNTIKNIENKIYIIPNGVNQSVFYPISKNVNHSARKKVLMVGHLERSKGQHQLFDIVKFIDKEAPGYTIDLQFIGNGSLKNILLAKSRTPRWKGRVTIISEVTHSELANKYREADVVCVLSKAEGCPNVVLEALASGIPVLSTDVGDVRTIIKNMHNGYVVDKTNSEYIAKTLKEMLEKSWDPQVISESISKFTWKNCGQQIDLILSEIEKRSAKKDITILTYTTLFPNNVNPNHAIFVSERMKRVAQKCDLQVVAPVPYSPPVNILKRWNDLRNIVKSETQGTLKVFHPRYFITPKVFMSLYGWFLYFSTKRFMKKIASHYQFDVIDSHYIYPDGFAAVRIGKLLNKPVVISARGTDINLYPQLPIIRKLIVQTLKRADGLIAVCQALKTEMVALGIDESKIVVIPNGIDTQKFFAVDTCSVRKELNLPLNKKIILCVGNLNERKGHHIVIEALKILKDEKTDPLLIIVGEGEYRLAIEKTIRDLHLEDDVLLTGAKPHNEIYKWYNSCDIFCLASSREGWANVLLESMACGKPVVATKIWGTPEVVSDEKYGFLIDEREPKSIAISIKKALEKQWDRDSILHYAHSFKWDVVADKVIVELKKSLQVHR